MVKCSQARSLLALHVGQDLVLQPALLVHLESCARCAAYVQDLEGDRERLQQTGQMVREQALPIAITNTAALVAHVQREANRSTPIGRWLPHGLAMAAAVLLAVVVLSPWSQNQGPSQAAPMVGSTLGTNTPSTRRLSEEPYLRGAFVTPAMAPVMPVGDLVPLEGLALPTREREILDF